MERANELWQIDGTDWELADGEPVKIIDVIDDGSRLCAASRAHQRETLAAAWDTFLAGAAQWGMPEAFLSDNGTGLRAMDAAPREARYQSWALQALPPPDLRQSRTLPPNPQEMAPSPPHSRVHRPSSKTSSTTSATSTTTNAPTAPFHGPAPRNAGTKWPRAARKTGPSISALNA